MMGVVSKNASPVGWVEAAPLRPRPNDLGRCARQAVGFRKGALPNLRDRHFDVAPGLRAEAAE